VTATYHPSPDFEAARAGTLAAVDPRRQRVLHVLVHDRATPADPFDPREEAAAYASSLGLPVEEARRLDRVTREEAERIAANVAELDLVMAEPHMPRATAEALAKAWLGAFDASAVFLVNGDLARSDPPGLGAGPNLFHKDIEAGVLAVSPTRAGLFWQATDS
jgi:hypothetical protein